MSKVCVDVMPHNIQDMQHPTQYVVRCRSSCSAAQLPTPGRPGASSRLVVWRHRRESSDNRRRLDLLCFNGFHRAMALSADNVVTEFCKLWATPDVEKVVGYFNK